MGIHVQPTLSALTMEGLGASELLAGASVLDKPAEEFVNNENIEQLWAMKAFEHAEVYFNVSFLSMLQLLWF